MWCCMAELKAMRQLTNLQAGSVSDRATAVRGQLQQRQQGRMLSSKANPLRRGTIAGEAHKNGEE